MNTRFVLYTGLSAACLLFVSASSATMPTADEFAERAPVPRAIQTPSPAAATGATITLIALHRAATGPYFVVPTTSASSPRCCESSHASR